MINNEYATLQQYSKRFFLPHFHFSDHFRKIRHGFSFHTMRLCQSFIQTRVNVDFSDVNFRWF